MRNKLILMAALGIMLGGCAKDETEPAGTDNILPADGVVRVFPGVDGLQTRAAGRNTEELQKQGFYLHIQNTENISYRYLDGVKWTYSTNDGWTSDKPMLWERANREVTVTVCSGISKSWNVTDYIFLIFLR